MDFEKVVLKNFYHVIYLNQIENIFIFLFCIWNIWFWFTRLISDIYIKDAEISLFYLTNYIIWEINEIESQVHFCFMDFEYTEENFKKWKKSSINNLKSLKEYSKAQFWINNEIFYKDYQAAFLDRVKKKVEINEDLKPKKVNFFFTLWCRTWLKYKLH